MEPFPNIDIATEILSRLPAKSLVAFKCTSKRWNHLASNPSFLHILDKRSKHISGLFVQQALINHVSDWEFVNHVTITQTESKVENSCLDFLLEKVVLVACSNGILCCRSSVYHRAYSEREIRTPCKGFRLERKEKENLCLYICNPITREWVRIRPKEDDDATLVFGFAFHPRCSSSPTGSSFQLVNLQHSGKNGSTTYSFAIYSSETQKWEMSNKVFEFKSYIYPSKVVYCNMRFHWWTKDHHILTFHMGTQLSKLLKLPGLQCPESYRGNEYAVCLGESEGYFHYICGFLDKLNIWMLKDYDEPAWVLKYQLNLQMFYRQHPSLFRSLRLGVPCDTHICNDPLEGFVPFAFCEDVLYARVIGVGLTIFSYDFKTGKMIQGCSGEEIGLCWLMRDFISFPYRVSLLPLPLRLPLSPSSQLFKEE